MAGKSAARWFISHCRLPFSFLQACLSRPLSRLLSFSLHCRFKQMCSWEMGNGWEGSASRLMVSGTSHTVIPSLLSSSTRLPHSIFLPPSSPLPSLLSQSPTDTSLGRLNPLRRRPLRSRRPRRRRVRARRDRSRHRTPHRHRDPCAPPRQLLPPRRRRWYARRHPHGGRGRHGHGHRPQPHRR